jgi:hypothetical protein
MRTVTIAMAIALMTIFGCKPSDETAAPQKQDETISDDISAIAEEPMQSSTEDNPECVGFENGAQRPNSLAGVAIGDSADRVVQQLLCGDMTFEIDIRDANKFDGEIQIVGENFEDGITVKLAGPAGAEKVFQVERGAQYDHQPGPALEDFVRNIFNKFPKSKELTKISSSNGRREIGFATLENGQISNDAKAVSTCGYEHNRFSTNATCGLSFVVNFYSGTNPGLVRRYGATLSDEIYKDKMVALGRSDGQARKKEAEKNQVEQAKPVSGF